MNSERLDDVDRGILHLLQEDARHNTATDIADAVGVTANTVRNRIDRLEEDGIVSGYVPIIDYEAADAGIHMLVQCTVPIPKRGELAKKALSVDGVVGVHEVMTGQRNVRIRLVGHDTDAITAAVSRLEEEGLEVEEEELVKRELVRPFDHFGTDVVDR